MRKLPQNEQSQTGRGEYQTDEITHRKDRLLQMCA